MSPEIEFLESYSRVGEKKSVNDGVALLMMDPLVGSLASVRALHSSHWILPFIPKVIVIAKNLIENSQNFSDAPFSSTLSQIVFSTKHDIALCRSCNGERELGILRLQDHFELDCHFHFLTN